MHVAVMCSMVMSILWVLGRCAKPFMWSFVVFVYNDEHYFFASNCDLNCLTFFFF